MTATSARVLPFHAANAMPSGADVALDVTGSGTTTPRISAVDVSSGARLASWRDGVAAHLLDAPGVRDLVDGDGRYPCSRSCLRQLLLAAATVESSLEMLAARRDAVLGRLHVMT